MCNLLRFILFFVSKSQIFFKEVFLHFEFRGLILGGAYIWRGLFCEFYGTLIMQKGSVFEKRCSITLIVTVFHSNHYQQTIYYYMY